jgi:hypothetical protein
MSGTAGLIELIARSAARTLIWPTGRPAASQ